MPHTRSRAALLLAALALSACAGLGERDDAAAAWNDAQQMVLVTTPGWDATGATLRTYERDGAGWREVGNAAPAIIGRAGAAWGSGVHPAQDGPAKREGDGRAPAGVFAIGTAFGYDAQALTRLAYQPMTANDWCIDVPDSPYYNRIVDRSLTKASGLDRSTEPMRRDLHADGDQRYRLGFVIGHNPDNASGGGSCIFAHLWKAPDVPTAGCTAMDEATMRRLLGWLRADRKPVFVLLPEAEAARLRRTWSLPAP